MATTIMNILSLQALLVSDRESQGWRDGGRGGVLSVADVGL